MSKAKPAKPTRTESKQAITDSVARELIDAEAAARRAKTERLRAMRLAKETGHEKSSVKARPARKASKRRS